MTTPLARSYVQQHAQRRFPLWGPNSGGGEEILVCENRVFLISYGDAAQKPDDDGYEMYEIPRQTFETQWGNHPNSKAAVEYVRTLPL